MHRNPPRSTLPEGPSTSRVPRWAHAFTSTPTRPFAPRITITGIAPMESVLKSPGCAISDSWPTRTQTGPVNTESISMRNRSGSVKISRAILFSSCGRRADEINFIDGPQAFSKHYLHPEDNLGQTLHLHLEEYAPGGRSQMHFHVNEAIFYILDGKGFELHDGVRYEWEAGDIAVVPNHTVHQHNNADPQRPARVLV